MIGVISALSVFIALHSVPSMTGLKARIVFVIGGRIYLAIYSVVSTAALVWLFYEALDKPLLVGASTSLVLTLWLLHGGHAALVGADLIATLQSLR